MKRRFLCVLLFCLLLNLSACQGPAVSELIGDAKELIHLTGEHPLPTPSSGAPAPDVSTQPEAETSPEPTEEVSEAPTPSPAATGLLSSLPPLEAALMTPTPSSPTPGPTLSPTPSASASPKPSASPKASPTPGPSPSASASAAPSASPSATPKASAKESASPSPSPSATPSPTPKITITPVPTFTPYPDSMMAPIPQGVVYWTPSPTPEPTPTPEKPPEPTPEPTPVPANPKGNDIVAFALQYEGYNYLYGGKDPETGFDCSGFVWYVYQHFGVELNRTAAGQALNGEHVEVDAVQPGDILCFSSGGSWFGHAGIYVGDGMYIHAMDSSHGFRSWPSSMNCFTRSTSP